MKGEDPWEVFRVLKIILHFVVGMILVANEIPMGNEYVVANRYMFDRSNMNRFVDLNINPN